MWPLLRHKALTLALTSLTCFGCAGEPSFPSGPSSPGQIEPSLEDRRSPAEARAEIEDRARSAIRALKSPDLKSFSAFVHPEFGVRFSPYAYVDTANDLTFKANDVVELADSQEVRRWGMYDGTGDPIQLTFDDYYRDFIFDRDFSASDSVAYNDVIGKGNTIDNSVDIYPDAIIVEFFSPAESGAGERDDMAGLDWKSLRLVFERFRNQWYVVGVIHDQWTT